MERDFDEMVHEKYADELIRFATALVGPSAAADVLSMAVLRVFASRGWPNVHNQRAYLTRAVLNKARMNHRSTMRRRAREERSAPRERVEPPELRPEVLKRVARLCVRQRAVVILTYWDDLDTVEISRRLGLSPGSGRRHIARAHARLGEMMKDDQ